MKYLLDTNVLSDFVRGVPGVLSRLRAEPSTVIAVSAITKMEVEYGIARNARLSSAVSVAMRTLLDAVTILSFGREEARIAARLRATLAIKGKPIGAYDVLIAATGLHHGLIVVTANTGEFSRIGGLAVEDWRK
jgi:tRNA(fMet)-specific endonuclease VapC